MKFHDKYPHGKDDEPTTEGVVCALRRGPCAACSSVTRWYTFEFEWFICSEECLDQLHQSFAKAVSGSGG